MKQESDTRARGNIPRFPWTRCALHPKLACGLTSQHSATGVDRNTQSASPRVAADTTTHPTGGYQQVFAHYGGAQAPEKLASNNTHRPAARKSVPERRRIECRLAVNTLSFRWA